MYLKSNILFLNYLLIIVLLLYPSVQLLPQVKEYFPLSVGNTWTYDRIIDIHIYDQESISIIDTILVNEKNYYLFDQFFYVRELRDSVLFRIEEQKVIRNIDGNEQIWFDFSADIYDSWIIEVFDSDLDTTVQVKVSLISKNIHQTINGRYFENCYGFAFRNLFATEHDWSYTFAHGIGCILLEIGTSVPASFNFRNGIINNVEYSDLVNIVSNVPARSKNLPERSEILSIYPNPFNSSTIISLNIKVTKRIDLNIYDVNGKLVRSLLSGKLMVGLVEINWDPTDSYGYFIPSGIYFVKVFDRVEIITRKILFIK